MKLQLRPLMNQKISTLLIFYVKVSLIVLLQRTINSLLAIDHARHIGDSASKVKQFLMLSIFLSSYFFPIKFASGFYNLKAVDWYSSLFLNRSFILWNASKIPSLNLLSSMRFFEIDWLHRLFSGCQ